MEHFLFICWGNLINIREKFQKGFENHIFGYYMYEE